LATEMVNNNSSRYDQEDSILTTPRNRSDGVKMATAVP